VTTPEALARLIGDYVDAGCPESEAPRVILLAYKIGKNDGMESVLADLRAILRSDG
jgi:hypothetical protein